ncbi:MAG: Asp-tRNA(Asn)/Glu-tRNA(Gln) amidotransferase subunit GatC [Sandaracinaceae bacterium]|nr:Asp-tRNA(Asn)/Glu-tRNA(Gln) amidotransferase subunit GatC [Sandaracinaceae bacterium]
MSDTKITLEDVRKVARLSRLALDEAALAQMRGELSKILGHVASLNALDVSNVEPTYHAVPMNAPLRADVVQASLPRDEVFASAPKTEAGGFAVPKVMDGEG